jgi:predicted acetyltransferase
MHQVSVRDSRSTREDRCWIESVFDDYLADLAPAATGLFPALGEVGHGASDQLLRWFGDIRAQILTILYGEERAGFAMVHRPSPAEYSMAEFFIARPWRRLGIGAQAVRLIFDRFAGQWLITEHTSNTAAVEFWRRVVARYTEGSYEERIVNGEVHQRFATGPRRR